jgi:hypothetical protein
MMEEMFFKDYQLRLQLDETLLKMRGLRFTKNSSGLPSPPGMT